MKRCGIFLKNLIYGKNPVIEALKSKRKISEILVSTKARDLTKIINLAKEKSVVVKFCSSEKIKKFGEKTQGVVAFCGLIDFVSVHEILEFAKKRNSSPFILICDGVTDPHNLGAICRTAYAVGVHGVIIAKRRSAPINQTVEKTSAGAINHLNIAIVSNLVDAIKKLQKEGVFIYCADSKGESVYDFDFKGAVGLVVGSEEKGASFLVKKTCDGICKIPMKNKIDSLNVSVAAAVIMYEILKQNNF